MRIVAMAPAYAAIMGSMNAIRPSYRGPEI